MNNDIPSVSPTEETPHSPPEWWTPQEVAAKWRVSDDTILRQIANGKIPAMKVGGRSRIHVSVVMTNEQGAFAKTSVEAHRPTTGRRNVEVLDRVGIRQA